MYKLIQILQLYIKEFQILQANGLNAYKQKVEFAATRYKADRSELSDRYGQLLLTELKQVSNYNTRLDLIYEVCHQLASIPVQANSKASILVTFDYVFLRHINDTFWGFPYTANEIRTQLKISNHIVFAACGKQKEECEKENLSVNPDVVCIALQYLFICHRLGILDSDKHKNIKKAIDTHFTLDNSVIETALIKLYNALNENDKQQFIALSDQVSRNFTNNKIKDVFSSFSKNRVLTNDLTVVGKTINSTNIINENITLISSSASNGTTASTQSYELGSESSSQPDSESSVDIKVTNHFDKYNHPFGPISPPKKSSDQVTVNSNTDAPATHKLETVLPQVNIENRNNQHFKPKYDLSKIIWGVPPDGMREAQLREFKLFIKTLTGSEESVRMAIQFIILIKNVDQTLLCNTYREKAIELIINGKADIEAALNNIYRALTTTNDQNKFIEMVGEIKLDFNTPKHAQVKKTFQDFYLAHHQEIIHIEPPSKNNNNNNKNDFIWGVPQNSIIRNEQINNFKNHLVNIHLYDSEMQVCIALQFIILLKDGNQTISCPNLWPKTMFIIIHNSSSISKALSHIHLSLKTTDEKISFIRVLDKIAYSFKSHKYSSIYNSICTYCKELQIAIKVYDKNIDLLRDIKSENNPLLKSCCDLLKDRNALLINLIEEYISSNNNLFNANILYLAINRIRLLINDATENLTQNDSHNVQSGFTGHAWQQQQQSTTNNSDFSKDNANKNWMSY